MGKHEWTTIADAINEEIVPALGEYADDYDVDEIAEELADELRAAYGDATETHLPYAEKAE